MFKHLTNIIESQNKKNSIYSRFNFLNKCMPTDKLFFSIKLFFFLITIYTNYQSNIYIIQGLAVYIIS
jgi:hypothetical protein